MPIVFKCFLVETDNAIVSPIAFDKNTIENFQQLIVIFLKQ